MLRVTVAMDSRALTCPDLFSLRCLKVLGFYFMSGTNKQQFISVHFSVDNIQMCVTICGEYFVFITKYELLYER
jgi:hypothetical protein